MDKLQTIWFSGIYGRKCFTAATLLIILAVSGFGNFNIALGQTPAVIAVSGGGHHSLALKSDGTVWAWGGNGNGQIGDGSTIDRLNPVQVHGPGNIGFLSGVISIAAGGDPFTGNSFAAKSDGTVWAWGHGSNSPIQVLQADNTILLNVIMVAAGKGGSRALALKNDGTVWLIDNVFSPATQVAGITDVRDIAVGGNGVITFFLAVKNDGTVWAWGNNNDGQLGDGTTASHSAPAQVHGLNNVGFLTGATAVAAGGFADSLALMADGTVFAWGRNDTGQLGDGTTTRRLTPVQVVGLSSITTIAGGGYFNSHSLAIRSDGTAWAWGSNVNGELGDNSLVNSSIPIQVHGPDNVGFLTNVIDIDGGNLHTVSATNDGNAWAWGVNTSGQLGDGTRIQRLTPVQVLFVTSDTTPPSAPTNLTATAVSGSQINLSWTASTDNVGVAGYNVERCQGVGCTNFAEIAVLGNVTTYNNTGLIAGTNYSYRVRARDTSANFSGYSNTASATTPAPDTTPPTAPTSLTATAASASQINLAWTASTDNVGVTGYRVERCQGAGCTNFVQIVSLGNVTSYSDGGLLASTNYSYRVRAADAAGNVSGYSNVASATTLAPPGDADNDGLPDSQEGASAPHPYALDRVFLNTPGDALTQDNVKGKGTGESGTWISSATRADTDSDGVGDRAEVDAGLNGGAPDSDGDGFCDGPVSFPGACVAKEDANGNGIVDAGETDPAKADSMFRTAKSVSNSVIGAGQGVISFADGVNTQPTNAANVTVSDAALGGTTQARIYYLSGAMELRIKDEPIGLKGYGLRIKGSGPSGSATLLVGSVTLTKVQVSPGQEFVVTTSDLELNAYAGSPAVEQLLGGTTNVTVPVPAGNTATFPYDSTRDELGVAADAANPATLTASVQTGTLSYTKKIPANSRVNFSPDNDATAIGANCKVAGSSVDFSCNSITGTAPGAALVAVDTSGLSSQSLLVTSLGGGRTVGRMVRSGLPAVSEAFSDNGDELENTATTIGASPAHQIYAFRSNIGSAETVQARTGDGWASNSNFRLRPGVGVILSVASLRAEAMALNSDVVEADMLDGAGTLLFTAKLDPSEVIEMTDVQLTAKKGTITVVFPDGRQVNLAEGQSISGNAVDSDGDGLLDNVDACPQTAGNAAYEGCPVADKNIVTLHNVYLGGGTTSKAPLAGVRVSVFDRNNPDFQTVAGSKNPDGSLYGVIYEADAGRVGACVTASDGVCLAGEERVGDYLVVVKYVDAATGKTVYVGRPKSPTDFVDSNGDGVGDLATKEFQIMKVFRKGVFEGYRGGDKTIVTGSMLEMIVPGSGVWEGARSLYPFVFNSDSDWAVDVCAQVPQGYSLVGAYDENGDLVASTQCVQTAVANQTKVIAFEVKEVASPEPSFVGTLKVTHKGKVTPVEVRVSDIRRASFDMKLKEARAKVDASKKTARLIKVGASLWSIIRDALGLEGRNADIVTIGKKVARLNAIRVPEWGITEGRYDAEALPWGFALDLGGENLRLAS